MHFEWARVGHKDDWDLHALVGRAICEITMAQQDLDQELGNGAAEHEDRASRYLEDAFAINADHVREIFKKMTGVELPTED